MRQVLGAVAIATGLFSVVVAAQPQSRPATPAPPAEQRTDTTAAGPQAPPVTPAPRKNPYARLFTQTWGDADVQVAPVQEVGQTPNSRRVVCGMTVIQADPAVDRR